jgi:hypothetical protein
VKIRDEEVLDVAVGDAFRVKTVKYDFRGTAFRLFKNLNVRVGVRCEVHARYRFEGRDVVVFAFPTITEPQNDGTTRVCREYVSMSRGLHHFLEAVKKC